MSLYAWLLVGGLVGTVVGLLNVYRENTKERREAERRAGVGRYLEALEDER